MAIKPINLQARGSSPPRFLSIFLFLLLHKVVFCASESCPPGEITISGRCTPCPPGTYRYIATGAASRFGYSCRPCRKGTFNPNSGAVAAELCRPCYPGSATNTIGSTECTPCPPGTVANRGATQCLACGPGLFYSEYDYVDERNPSKCKPCPKNFYSSGAANLKCEQCPEGFTTESGATSASECVLCPAGTETYLGSKGCSGCGSGKFKPTAAPGRCMRCPPDMFAPRRTKNTRCRTCPVGFRRKDSDECSPCPDGLTTASRGARFCRKLDFPCPSSMFENKNGDCEKCAAGYRLNRAKRICQKCPLGSVGKGGLEEKCTTCPTGQSPDTSGRACRCPDGYFPNEEGICKMCPPGTFKNVRIVFLPFSAKCDKCDLGTFSDSFGTVNCKPCPIGTVADKRGATRCKKCPKGMMPNIGESFADEEATHCVDLKTGCLPGYDRDRYCMRVACTTETKPEDIGRKCVLCEAGEKVRGNRCVLCGGERLISPGGTVTNCTRCPNGMFRSFTETSVKCNCLRGGFGMEDGECKPCGKGTFSAGGGVCKPCPPGSFSATKKAFGCRICPFGKVAETEGAEMCVLCPAGKRPNTFKGATSCVSETS